MSIDLFAGIPVRDLERSVGWYRDLLGSDVTFRPDDTEAVWQLGEQTFIYLKAGHPVIGGALVAILVDDLPRRQRVRRGVGSHARRAARSGFGVMTGKTAELDDIVAPPGEDEREASR